MWNRLVILGVGALIVAAILVAVYYQQRNTVGDGYDIKCAQGSQPSSATSALTCEIRPSQKADQGKPKPQWWNVLLAWPEGITAWLLLLTLGGIVWQAQATADSVEAMKRSIVVQEAEFVQWIDIGEWKIEYDRGVYQLTRSETKIFNHPGEMKVKLSFPLLNNTARPLFIKSVRTLLAIGTEKVFKTFSTEESIPVPPKDEYRVVIDMTLDKEQVTGYIAYTLPIEAVVEVNFSNALHKPDYAGFRRLVVCNAFDGITTVSKGHASKQIDNQETT
jgi:hypothetical protein